MSDSNKVKHIIHAAQYNIGRAYFQGYGVERQSDKEAEKWWLLAADDGNPKASVMAQTVLGMFYSREDSMDLQKAFFWHSEACGNGSVESQGRISHFNDVNILASQTECLPGYICKGIAMGCFYYARCLQEGHGVKQNKEEAKKYYSKAYQYDPDICARLQGLTQHGVI
ncbi:hypothetical protein KUTeg_010609 [Tegillarca granosa]|nr:hypothetical protein KUTeg_010609 [Tegillarca granosa]